jgi:hypothetical protein
VVLGKQGYIPSKFTPGLFTHKTRTIAFSLVVDDFGVKDEKKEDMDHLVKTLGDRYPIKVDLKAEFYLGITIKWDYDKRTAKLSMPGYVKEALLEFQHEGTTKAQMRSNLTHHHHIHHGEVPLIPEQISKDIYGTDRRSVVTQIFYGDVRLIPARIPKYITGTDRLARLDASFNTRYAVKYHVFAQYLTPIGAQTPLIY